ncbi:MAG: zinc-binding dehydrogenase, partial [Acetatifactor sp.]|nr:zinc-binding dehydrogenase [Acetatifactor sp.]
IGKHPEKLELFKPFSDTTLEREKEGDEIVVEATGSPSGIRQALELVRKKGTIVLKSTYAGEVSLPFSQIAVNEITIVGSRCGPFAPALEALASGRAQFPEITLFSLKEYEEAFAFEGFKAGFSLEQPDSGFPGG